MNSPSLVVATVCYGSPALVREHLITWSDSLRHLEVTRPDVTARVEVVDNGAATAPIGDLTDLDWGSCRLRVLERPDNPGFAAGANLAARDLAGDEWLVLLNPDVAVDLDFFERLVEHLEAVGNGVLGAIPLETDGTRDCGVGIGVLLHFRDRPDRHRARLLLAGPSGGGAVVPAAAWHILGGLWEPFFAWGEDGDLALRAWSRGWVTTRVPVAARHIGGHTVTNAEAARRKAALLMRNRLWYLARSARPSLVATLALPWALVLIAIMVRNLMRRTAGATVVGALAGLHGWSDAARSTERSDKLTVVAWLRLAQAAWQA